MAGVKKGGTTEPLRPLDEAVFCILKGVRAMAYRERAPEKRGVPGMLALIVGITLNTLAEKRKL